MGSGASRQCKGLKSSVGLHPYLKPSPTLPGPTHTMTVSQPLTRTKLQFSDFPVCISFSLERPSILLKGQLFLIFMIPTDVPALQRYSHSPSRRASCPQTLSLPVFCCFLSIHTIVGYFFYLWISIRLSPIQQNKLCEARGGAHLFQYCAPSTSHRGW